MNLIPQAVSLATGKSNINVILKGVQGVTTTGYINYTFFEKIFFIFFLANQQILDIF